MAASSSEPFAMAVIRRDASAAFPSNMLAPSAYSSFLTLTVFGYYPTVTPTSETSCKQNILHNPAMKATGEKISP